MISVKKQGAEELTCLDDALWYATRLHNILFRFLFVCGCNIIPCKLSRHGLYSNDDVRPIDVPERYRVCDTILVYMHDDLRLSTCR